MQALLRALLWLTPREFRGRYGSELVSFYEQRLRGKRVSLRERARVVGDLLATIILEWGRVAGTLPNAADQQRTLSSEERMSVFGQEVVHAARALRKSRGFTAGIGGITGFSRPSRRSRKPTWTSRGQAIPSA
jgi:hypothetical protein